MSHMICVVIVEHDDGLRKISKEK